VEDIVQGETVTFVETDVDGRFSYFIFTAVCLRRRKVNQVEVVLDRYGYCFQAPIARGRYVYFQVPLHSNVSYGMVQQFRPALGMQIRGLGDGPYKLYFARRYIKIEADWILFQLRKTDKHN